MNALSHTVVYLLVLLIEALQPSGEMTVDYLQDLAPAMEITVAPLDGSGSDVYVIDARVAAAAVGAGSEGARGASAASGEFLVPVRVEQSDLYAHHYVAFSPGAPPAVMDLSEVRRELARVNRRSGSLPAADTAFDFSGDEEWLSGPVHLLERGQLTILAAETSGVLLVVR